MSDRPRLLFVVTEDWYFWSHRLPMARAALAAGYDVAVATRVTAHGDRIRAEGVRVLPLRALSRQGRNPFREMRAIAELAALYRHEKPALVHHVALKPVLYGSIAARLAGVRRVVNAMAGMGFVFASRTLTARVLRPPVTLAFRFLLKGRGARLLVQNTDDRAFFGDAGLCPPDRIVLIPGSGVDVTAFQAVPEPSGPPVALFVARLIEDKGVGELVAAARRLKERGIAIRVQLAGAPDVANPGCISETTIAQWKREGVVEILGHRDDIVALWQQAHIAVLPTRYREGVPKSLLEAAASGRPIIATDMPGCRDLVRHGENGLLVPVGDIDALAGALERLASDRNLRQALGREARRDAEKIYSEESVGERIVALYDSLMREVEG